MKIKITPDREKASSILKMIETREKFLIETIRLKAPATIIAESYYEIIKEVFTALLLLEGYKFIGENAHKELIDFVKKYKKFDEFEIETIQDLRIKRNKSSYEGKPIEEVYLENKKEILLKIIEKSKLLLKSKLE